MNNLHMFLFIFYIVRSSPFPNSWNRGIYSNALEVKSRNTPSPDHTYTIYLSDPNNLAELSSTSTSLQSLADQDVHDDWNGNKLFSWRVLLKDGASIEEVEGHKGI